MDSQVTFVQLMKPYHVRKDKDAGDPWQQYYMCDMASTGQGVRDGLSGLRIQQMTDSGRTFHPCFAYKFTNFPNPLVKEGMLFDEVKKKLYFFHAPNLDSKFIVREATAEVTKMPNGNRTITDFHSIRLFFGHYRSDDGLNQWFLNPLDGSIFQIKSVDQFVDPISSSHTVSWIKLDDSIQVDAPYSDDQYAGKVKVMDKYKLEFPRYNLVDFYECGILFSESGKKMLMRFRVPNPEYHLYSSFPRDLRMREKEEMMNELMTSPDLPYTHQMAQSPTYALFGLDYDTRGIQLLTQFVPSSQKNHSALLISTSLLSVFANGLGFPNSAAQSYLGQRSYMLGKYLKYTFFSAMHKGKIAIVAVKSLMTTLQHGGWSKSPKKVWFPLDDEEFNKAFGNLSERNITREMLTQKNNFMLVFGNEFIVQVCHPDIRQNPTEQLATIRMKLGIEYKDYRKCAGCEKVEEYKRRSKTGKRMSQFKVCGWCKDHNVHKMLEIPCHYCSEGCADDHWQIHQLEHKIKQKGKKKTKK